MKKPAHYAAPLRSRKSIIAFLVDHDGRNRGYSPLAWEVKVQSIDLSYEKLRDVYKAQQGDADLRYFDFPEYDLPARAKYAEVEDKLWEWGVETACHMVSETDAYKSLFSGKELDVTYGFAGRSGGWLVMEKYNGTDLTSMDAGEFETFLEEMSYGELRDLYQLVVQDDHDFSVKNARSEITHHAAFDLFENVCADIVQPTMTQLSLAM